MASENGNVSLTPDGESDELPSLDSFLGDFDGAAVCDSSIDLTDRYGAPSFTNEGPFDSVSQIGSEIENSTVPIDVLTTCTTTSETKTRRLPKRSKAKKNTGRGTSCAICEKGKRKVSSEPVSLYGYIIFRI